MLKRVSPAQWLCLALAVLFAALAFAAYYTDTLPNEQSVSLIPTHKTGVGMLTPESQLTQTFRAQDNDLSAVDVMVSNYNKKVKEGALTLTVLDDEGWIVGQLKRPVEGLRNNAFITIPFTAPMKDSRGRIFTLHAASDCVEQKGVTLRMGPLPQPDPDTSLTLPDGAADGENALNLRLCYTHVSYGSMAFSTLLIIAVCFAACIPLGKRKEDRHE